MSLAASMSVPACVPAVPECTVALPASGGVADPSAPAAPDFLALLGLLDVATGTAPELADVPTDAVPPQDGPEAAEEGDAVPAMPSMAPVPTQLMMALPVPVTAVVAVTGASGKAEAEPDDTLSVVTGAAEAPRSAPTARSVDGAAPRHAVPQEMAAVEAARAGAVAPRHIATEGGSTTDASVNAAAAPAKAVVPTGAEAVTATGFPPEDAPVPAAPLVAPQASEREFLPAVKLSPGTPAQWRQPLAEALGDRLQLNLQRGNDQAVIRLEPPQLGRIDIAIRHEAGSLQVHLSATHGEVVRQLQTIGDSLRQDLGQRAYGDVSVVVGDASMGRDADGRSRGRPQQPEDAGPGRALAEAESGAATAFRMGPDTSDIR